MGTMAATRKICIVCLIGLLVMICQAAAAAGKIATTVKVIHASTASSHIDPQLKGISAELKSVFKYTSYRLLKAKQMRLGFNEKGSVSLPGSRTLVVAPSDMNKKRIRYQINILKNKKSVFNTQVLLKNNNSITIGGPQHKDGVLIFNISGSAD